MADNDDWNAKIIAEFRENDGQVGGQFAGAPLLILHTKGARTGAERVQPLMYLADGERYVIFASKAGAPSHPDWYHNLRAHPDVVIEVGSETFGVTATVVEGDERDRLYARQAELYPGFAEYQAKTDRVIPVVALTRT